MEGSVAVKSSRRKRLTGHGYRQWVKLLLKAKRSEIKRNRDESKLQRNGEKFKYTETNFAEYWVPVRLSNLQTEQYCSLLFSNSTDLCSSYEFDLIKILHEMLVSAKKCCDHPYLLNRSFEASLMEGIPQSEKWDAQIKLSSKLLLLYKTLLEIHKRGLRVLVLYQKYSPGSEPVTIGDILDDIIHQKFGKDSYIRIDGYIFRSKRQAIIESFNDKRGGKFVCLMEIRDCSPNITLKSIDTVIFFNSDWDPMNDLKALQRINLHSQFQPVNIFRFYSAYTVEEKVLILTKQGTAPEGSLRNINRSTSHKLLTWGAYFLFQMLDELHNISTIGIDSSLEDVFDEMCILLPNNEEMNVDNHRENSLVLGVDQIGGVYNTNISLLGEVEYPLMENFAVIEDMLVKEQPYVFWMNMLEGRNPRWKYFPSHSSRARKCVRNRDHLLESFSGAETDGSQTPLVRRSRNRLHTQGKGGGERKMETPMADKPSPTELQSAFKALEIELERLQKQKTESSKQHEDMKKQIIMARDAEIDQIQKKYEETLQNADAAFFEEKLVLETRYNRVLANKALTESLISDSTDAPPSQATMRFALEQACQLLSQQPKSSNTVAREEVEEGIVQPTHLEASRNVCITGGCLRAPAPHLRPAKQSPLSAVSMHQFKRPGIVYSQVTLQKGTSTSNS